MRVIKNIVALTFVMLLINTYTKAQTLDIDRSNMKCGGLEATFYAIDPLTCTVVGTSSTVTIPLGTSTISYSTAALAALFTPPLPPNWEIGAIDIFTPISCGTGPGTSSVCLKDFMTVGSPNVPCAYTAADCIWTSPTSGCGTCVAGQVTQASFTSGTTAVLTLY